MKKTVILTLFFILCFSLTAKAETESWYTQWGGGLGQLFIQDGALSSYMEDNYDQNVSLGFDLLGFYWPISDSILLGTATTGSFNFFKSENDALKDMVFIQYQVSVSGEWYLTGDGIGDGLFFRTDLGITQAISTEGEFTDGTEVGVGINLGVGYAIKMSEGESILISLLFNHAYMNDDFLDVKTNNLHITFAGLF